MQIKAIQKTTQNVIVDVTPTEIMEIIKNAIKKRHPDLDYDYIDYSCNNVMKFEHYHNGSKIYLPLRSLTERDKIYDEILNDIHIALIAIHQGY